LTEHGGTNHGSVAHKGQGGGSSILFDRRLLQALATTATIFATSMAFFASPIVRFVDPGQLVLTGFVFAIGTAMVWFSTLVGEGSRLSLLFNLLIAVAGVLGLLSVIGHGWYASALNDRRCLDIERGMLAVHPTRSDLPDLFQALGCRPRTTLRIVAEGPSRELKK
jgi:hypothetical protein